MAQGTKTSAAYDVGVIGGGAIGLACAWRLAQRGARVGLFERGQIGREASWAAAGMLAAQVEAAHHPPADSASPARSAMLDLCLKSRALYPSFAEELLETTNFGIGLSLQDHTPQDWRTPGILYIADDENDATIAAFGRQREQDLRVVRPHETASPWFARVARQFSGQAATSSAPVVAVSDTRRAVWLPDEGQVDNRLLVKALERACRASGVEVQPNCEVRHVRFHQNRVTGIETSRGGVFLDGVLLCAGAWSEGVWSKDGPSLPPNCAPPTRPVAGQMLSLRLPKGKRVPHIIYAREAYIVPRRDGRILVGATMEEVGFERRVTVQGARHLLEAAVRLWPDLEHATLEAHWAGLRPATPDSLPILGRTPLENLFVATGHFRNGILLTPVTAQLMADCILDDKQVPEAFRLERFHP